jgi:peptidoglycan/LPS O-acetylase OafA/YrhL
MPPKHSQSFYIPSLDGIRAASFMLVFVAHAGLGDRVPAGLGVTVFFFLSGFLITTLLRLEFEKTGGVSMRAFYLRRALRILPPMYATMAAAYLVAGLGLLTDRTLSPLGGVAQALHFTNYWLIARWDLGPTGEGLVHGTGVMWSLAIEEHFYLVYPITFVALVRAFGRRRAAIALGVACAAVLAWRLVLIAGLHQPGARTYLGTDTRIDNILFGCILGLVCNPAVDRPIVTARLRVPAVALGLSMLLLSLLVRDRVFQDAVRYSLQGLALVPLFSAAVAHPEWGPFRLLNLRPVRFVGVLSYSLYLVHHVVIFTLAQQLPGVGAMERAVLAFAVAFGIALAFYYLLEKPCARLRKRLSRVGATPRRGGAEVPAGVGLPSGVVSPPAAGVAELAAATAPATRA